MIIALVVIAVVAIFYGLVVRGAVFAHEVTTDTPALVAYFVAVFAASTAGFLARIKRGAA